MNPEIIFENHTDYPEIGMIRINRPEFFNALNVNVIKELNNILDRIENEDSWRCLIIYGEKNFAAGADITNMVNFTPQEAYDFNFIPVFNRLENLNIPTIAAISGYALGGGLELALACDLRFGSENAKVGLPEINLGIMPGGGGTVRLSRLIGEGRAKEMILFGKHVSADEALNLGIITRIEKEENLIDSAVEAALSLSRKSPQALAAAKQMLHTSHDSQLLEMEQKSWSMLFQTSNQKEGMTAFLEKRSPRFT